MASGPRKMVNEVFSRVPVKREDIGFNYHVKRIRTETIPWAVAMNLRFEHPMLQAKVLLRFLSSWYMWTRVHQKYSQLILNGEPNQLFYQNGVVSPAQGENQPQVKVVNSQPVMEELIKERRRNESRSEAGREQFLRRLNAYHLRSFTSIRRILSVPKAWSIDDFHSYQQVYDNAIKMESIFLIGEGGQVQGQNQSLGFHNRKWNAMRQGGGSFHQGGDTQVPAG
ncbi:hypothetical protein Droror1_Dr00000323, partial [Drosera rotundifolia]